MHRVAALVIALLLFAIGMQTIALATDVIPRCVALRERMGASWRDASDTSMRGWWREAENLGCTEIATGVGRELDRDERVVSVVTPPDPPERRRSAEPPLPLPPMPPRPVRLEPPVCPPTAIGWIDLMERRGVYFAPGYTDGTQIPTQPAKNQRILVGPNGVPFYRAQVACPNPSRCDWDAAGVTGSVEIVELERFEVGIGNLRRWQLCVRQ